MTAPADGALQLEGAILVFVTHDLETAVNRWVRDLGGEVERLTAAGYAPLAVGGVPGASDAIYDDAYAAYGRLLKALATPEDQRQGLARAQAAHRTWDGHTRPVRDFRELVAYVGD